MKYNFRKILFFTSFFVVSGLVLLGNVDTTMARPSEDAIQIDGSTSKSISENLATGTSIGVLTTPGDDGGTNAPYTYSLACTTSGPGADDEHFQIDGDQLEVATVFDHETSVAAGGNNYYEICIKSIDSLLNPAYEQTIGITVNNVTSPITNIQIAGADAASQVEGVDANSVIGSLEVTIDDNGEESEPYYLDTSCEGSGDDNDFFQINGSDLENIEVFDYDNPADNDGDNNYEVCVGAFSDDTDSLLYQKDLTISVTELPVVSSSKKSSSRRISRAAVNQIFGTPTTTTTTTTPSPSSDQVYQIQMKLISLLTQLIASMKG